MLLPEKFSNPVPENVAVPVRGVPSAAVSVMEVSFSVTSDDHGANQTYEVA